MKSLRRRTLISRYPTIPEIIAMFLDKTQDQQDVVRGPLIAKDVAQRRTITHDGRRYLKIYHRR